MGGHHLILGELEDYVTGIRLEDTHDERYRQKIARLLVSQRGYRKEDIKPREPMLVRAGENRAIIKIDFSIKLSEKIGMIINYGPGSIVSRRRSVLAMSRLIAPYQVPLAVATNGEDAEVLEGPTGRVVSRGLKTIPSREELMIIAAENQFNVIPPLRAEMESRILYCYEVDGSCACNEDVCKL
jgi:hypothetical protein